jgi:hypothetical protein
MLDFIKKTVRDFNLDLTGMVVLTEAANGPYSSTPIIAAEAGAKEVLAFVKDNKFSSAEDVITLFKKYQKTYPVVKIISELNSKDLSRVNIVTNAGNLRPINKKIISNLSDDAVVSLMYESWEFRKKDIDIDACKKHNLDIVAPFEFNDLVGFDKTLIEMVNYGLKDVDTTNKTIGVISDNKFGEIICHKLINAKKINTFDELDEFSVVVLARTANLVDDYLDLKNIKEKEQTFLQLWGNIDRRRFDKFKNFTPLVEPDRGHMGVLPSDIGGEHVVKLQTCGLKVAEAYLKNNKQIERYGDFLLKN